jgi:glycogen debranching enzyme
MDDDALIAAGEPGFQLTWMDARIGDRVVTPRIGKPVEIQCLWINALAIAGARDARWKAIQQTSDGVFHRAVLERQPRVSL